MAFDTARGVTVLFGGYTGLSGDGRDGETWEWNGTVWNQRMVIGPAPRADHAMVYDPARAVTVLFGGSPFDAQSLTWEWNGIAWTLRSASGPLQRFWHAMAYDVGRGKTVLFGGSIRDRKSVV